MIARIMSALEPEDSTEEIPHADLTILRALGVRPMQRLDDRFAIREARFGAHFHVYRNGATGAVGTIGPDLQPGPVYVDDEARVLVHYRIKDQAVDPLEMPIGRFGAWVVKSTAADVLSVGIIAPGQIAAYGVGYDGTYDAFVWDIRQAAQLLLRRDVLSDYADRTQEGARLRDAINALAGDEHPWRRLGGTDAEVVAAGASFQLLTAEAIKPTTVGDPVGYWAVTRVSPFTVIKSASLPPVDGTPRRGAMRSAITGAVSQEAYFRTRPGYAGSRERLSPLVSDAIAIGHVGRSWSAAAEEERKRRRVNLARRTLTVAEYEALSLDQLLILNLIEYGRIGWQHEVSTGTLAEKYVKRYRGGTQHIWLADPTGDTAVGLLSATLSLPEAALRWTTAGMSFDRPFANVDEVRGTPTVDTWRPGRPVQWATTAGAVLLDRLLDVGLTERQAVVMLNVQAGWTAEQIHDVLNIARSTVAAHLSAARKILRRNRESD